MPLSIVMPAIAYLLASRRYRVERTLAHAEFYDHLTRLPTRTAFLRRLEETLVGTSAERSAVAVEMPFVFDRADIRVTASLGVAPGEDPSPRVRDELVRRANAARRRVKSNGRAGLEAFFRLTFAAA